MACLFVYGIGSLTHNYHLTFDIDWAPDASIELCLDLLGRHGVKGTFFATHVTDMNREIVSRGHDLGEGIFFDPKNF